jgi:hypothetical protein
VLERKGIDNDKGHIYVCDDCGPLLAKNELPRRSYANGLWAEPLPEVLSRLTPVECSLIARVHTHAAIYKIHGPAGLKPCQQNYFRGNVISFLQDPVKLRDTILPLPLSVIADRLRLVFVGMQFDRSKAVALLAVSRARVLAALNFLKRVHPGYEDVDISDERMNALPDGEDIVPDALWNLVAKTGESGPGVDSEGKGYVPEPGAITEQPP